MTTKPRKELSLFDSTCLIVGIIIGAGIYQMAPQIASGVGGVLGVFAIWIVGGLLSLCGALGYAELATAYPEEGGDYVYLTRAYGRWAGFLFGWIQLAVVRPGDIAVMAFAFAMYAAQIYDPFAGSTFHSPLESFPLGELVYAVAATVILTAINIIGVREGKWTQNILTTVKALGLLAIAAVAVAGPRAEPRAAEVEALPMRIALIFVLFTYGGWNEMAYVAAEVRDARRNIVRALVAGTATVTVLYLLANAAFLWSLGYEGVATSRAVAADTVSTVFPEVGSMLISALVCISALGAVNGLVFAGARISYAMGTEHRVFRALGRWNDRTGTPVCALLLQGALAVAVILLLGSFAHAILYAAAAVYSFYLATSIAVIVLRRKDPRVERPYRVTGYPLPPLLFAAVCIFLIHGAVTYKPQIAGASVVVLLAGLPVYLLSNWLGARAKR